MSRFKLNICHIILELVYLCGVFAWKKVKFDWEAMFESVCFKMENEMERKFYEQLDAEIENKRKTISYLWMVKSTSYLFKICPNWNEESVRKNQ